MRRRWRLAYLFLPLAAGCGGPRAETPAPRGATTSEISPADLRTRSYIFSDDSMQGRQAGTAGNARGNAYIAGELARLGLRPGGDQGGYLQRVPLMRYAVDTARGTLQAGSVNLRALQDYFPYQPSFDLPVRPIDGAQVVYIGARADSAALPAREALQGKVVVFRSEAAGQSIAGPDMSPDGRLGLAAGIVITDVDRLIAGFAGYLRAPRLEMASDVKALAGVTQPRLIFVPTGTAQALFGKPLDALHPGDAGPTLHGEISFAATDLSATNVVGILEGSDSALRGEYVALGAHNDAIGIVAPVDHDSIRAFNSVMLPRGANDAPGEPSPEQLGRIRGMLDSLRRLHPARADSIVNGADDDGSGSMGLLEVAESFARRGAHPKRSLLFVWHTGEESGLQGSRWFTDHPTVPRDSIVSQINVDMIARGGPQDEPKGGPGYLQVIGSRRLSTELGDLVETVNREGKHGMVFDYTYDANGHPDNFYCRSDHYSYARYGIPIAFLSTGGHRDYHQVTDEPEYLDYVQFARVTRFLADLADRVANLDHRIVVDKPKPDPEAPCHQ
jgi:hypothetical protein